MLIQVIYKKNFNLIDKYILIIIYILIFVCIYGIYEFINCLFGKYLLK